MKEEKLQGAQLLYLNKRERNDPQRVLREFKEDLSIEAVRKVIISMRDVCSTTENVPYGDPKEREDLFYVTNKILRFFEASYIQLASITGQLYTGDVYSRQLTVFEKEILRNIQGVPNTVPCISLYGKWLSMLGFHPGNRVTVVGGPQQIFISMTKEWNEKMAEVKIRA